MCKSTLSGAVTLAALCVGLSGGAAVAAPCNGGKPVTFAGLGWESGEFITDVVETILSKGYGCKVETTPGTSVVLEHATVTGDVQIFAEQWDGRDEVWAAALKDGTVANVGHPFTGAKEAWFVPDYLVNGDPARHVEALAPDLKSVSQLSDPKYVKLFSDPEEPSKGRLLNCPSGWSCERINSAKLQAYKLDKDYVNFKPGTGTAMDASITSAYLQGEPILFYYWSPTALMGKYKVVQLEEPPYTADCWKQLSDFKGTPDHGCAFPAPNVVYGVNSAFVKSAPDVTALLEKATIPVEVLNKSLAYMVDHKVDAAAAANEFLRTREDVWGPWVSAEAKAKIEASRD